MSNWHHTPTCGRLFHTKFCTKPHLQHSCNKGGTAGGAGGTGGIPGPHDHHVSTTYTPDLHGFTPAPSALFTLGTTPLIGLAPPLPPSHQVPGPVAGSGVIGLAAGLLLLATLRRWRRG